jgi:hypothetical protein
MGINLDLSKVLHPRAWDLLTAFMPGFFFEICFLLGNPQLINSLTPTQLERPIVFIAAAVLAFVIGNVCMLWVKTIQIILTLLLRIWFWFFPPIWQKLLLSLVRGRGEPTASNLDWKT